MHAFRIAATALLLAATGAAQAAPNTPATPVTDCVDLAPDHQTFSFGSQYLLIQDGNAHYRVSFSGSCGAIGLGSQVEISTQGTTNRLCPRSTRVTSRAHTCNVSAVDQIDADRYNRYRRMSR